MTKKIKKELDQHREKMRIISMNEHWEKEIKRLESMPDDYFDKEYYLASAKEALAKIKKEIEKYENENQRV